MVIEKKTYNPHSIIQIPFIHSTAHFAGKALSYLYILYLQLLEKMQIVVNVSNLDLFSNENIILYFPGTMVKITRY